MSEAVRDGSEPLPELARLAWDQAPALCHPAHGCEDYHRAWGMVRWLLSDGRSPSGEAFFHREMARLVKQGARRVLVSGGADSGVSAMVVKGFRAVGIEPELVFADRCATALAVNVRYAEVAGVKLQAVLGDLCDLNVPPVDVVVAHTFLPFFEGPKRQAVLDTWHRLLKPGGEVLFSNVLRASEADWSTQKNPEALLSKAQELLERTLAMGFSEHHAQAVVAVATRFWSVSPGCPPGMTEANVRQGLLQAGFEDIQIQYNPDEVYSGPISLVRQRTQRLARAEVIAVRR